MKSTVYVCGNIKGKTKEDYSVWREYVTQELEHKFDVINPLRDRDYENFNYNSKDVFQRDINDVKISDYVLCKMSDLSLGSIFELGYGYAIGSRLIIVLEDDAVDYIYHPFIIVPSEKVFTSLDEAIDYLIEI